jgi:hypothetical protein
MFSSLTLSFCQRGEGEEESQGTSSVFMSRKQTFSLLAAAALVGDIIQLAGNSHTHKTATARQTKEIYFNPTNQPITFSINFTLLTAHDTTLLVLVSLLLTTTLPLTEINTKNGK